MASTTDIVAKLWALCNVLRDDGVTYNEYVSQEVLQAGGAGPKEDHSKRRRKEQTTPLVRRGSHWATERQPPARAARTKVRNRPVSGPTSGWRVDR